MSDWLYRSITVACSLRVGAESAAAHRELSAISWVALETLALQGAWDAAGRWVATSNVRDLGQRLGIGKDRAAAALAELRRAGLVVAHIGRDARSARFSQSRYEVCIPVSSGDNTAQERDVAAGSSRTSPRPRHAGSKDDSLNLFSDI